jgi:hypothetical protein
MEAGFGETDAPAALHLADVSAGEAEQLRDRLRVAAVEPVGGTTGIEEGSLEPLL